MRTKSRSNANFPNTIVSVLDYGAVGDGVVDDTLAIQAALDSDSVHLYFPPGTYVVSQQTTTYSTLGDAEYGGGADVTPALYSNRNNRTLTGPGTIFSNTPIDVCFFIQANNNAITLNCSGNFNIAGFLRVEGADNTISNCVIKNLKRGRVNSCEVYGIWHKTLTDSSLKISDNIISNCESIGDTGSDQTPEIPGIPDGDGAGMARAIKVESRLEAPGITKQVLINNNVINSISGEEGDPIVVISRTGVRDAYEVGKPIDRYVDAGALISNNTITGFSRRALKIQAWDTTVVNNVIRNTDEFVPSGSEQAVIDFVQGGDHVCMGNVLENCTHRAQIKVLTNGSYDPTDPTSHPKHEAVRNISITNNTIRGIGAETSSETVVDGKPVPKVVNLVYIEAHGEGVIINNNIIIAKDFDETGIASINNPGAHISNNHVITQSPGKSFDVSLDPDSTFGVNSAGKPYVTFGGQFLSNSEDNERANYSMYVDTAHALDHSFVSYNTESQGFDEVIAGQIEFGNNDYASYKRQQDNIPVEDYSYENGITSSIQAVYQGSVGKNCLDINTGGNDFHTRFESTGSLLLGDKADDELSSTKYDNVKFGYLADRNCMIVPQGSSLPDYPQPGWLFYNTNTDELFLYVQTGVTTFAWRKIDMSA